MVLNLCPSITGLFAQSLCYAQKIILEILNICLRLFFSHALILDKTLTYIWTLNSFFVLFSEKKPMFVSSFQIDLN